MDCEFDEFVLYHVREGEGEREKRWKRALVREGGEKISQYSQILKNHRV